MTAPAITIKSLFKSLLISLALTLSVSNVFAAELTRAGWVEKAVILPHQLILNAKLDTGARTSSLNAADHEIFMRDGEDWARIIVTNRDNESVTIEAPVVRQSRIKRHFGERQSRPVILLDLCIGSARKKAEVNLVDRSGMNYQLLIGRSFLKDALLIDSGATYVLSPDCSR